MSLKRIAYVLHIFPKLSETFVAGELAELRRRGIEVRILSLLPPREELRHDIIRRAGLAEVTIYDVAEFENVIRDFKPQLLHAHFATEATAKARELSSRCQVPFTFTAHGYDIHRKPPSDFQERALAAGRVVTVSEANADHITKTFNVPREHLSVIPCGVDTDEFCPNGNAALDGEPWIVCVARHVAVKNLGLLLDACVELRWRGVKFRCAMIGDGPLHHDLRQTRDELKLTKLVEMPGALDQSEVLKWWQRAAVGVLSSENEGMPVCLMEAAACGVPVVAPSVGGIPELVQDGITGLLSNPNDATSLADGLETILQDEPKRKVFSKAARDRAEKKFSVRRQVDELMNVWSGICNGSRPQVYAHVQADNKPTRAIPVLDPFNAAEDAALPTVAAALNPEVAAEELKRHLPRAAGPDGMLRLRAIRVIRHKPGKRAVIEYDVRQKSNGVKGDRLTLIGKLRARRSGNEGFRQQEMIWNAGFQADSADGISVPEPLGAISALKMWFQRKVAGKVSTKLLAGSDGVAVARRVAEAMHKLHQANLPTEKTHTPADELRILHECFDKLVPLKPALTGRLVKLYLRCEKLAANMPEPKACGIHRDFYSSQVIVERGLQAASTREYVSLGKIQRPEPVGCGSGVNAAPLGRLWLIDFDCFCLGDPGLDAGNFIGHVTEQALREHGDPDALRKVEVALEDRFVELSGERVRPAVRAYTTLTLARHIYLSSQFPERRHLTERLLELCEQRLATS